MPSRVKVLIAARSSLAASLLSRDLGGDATLQVAVSSSPQEFWKQMSWQPSVIVLDVAVFGSETPTVIAQLRAQQSAAILFRADRETSPELSLHALEAGAIAVLCKPNQPGELAECIPTLVWNIHAASKARAVAACGFQPVNANEFSLPIALGAGMGSLPTLTRILQQLPADSSPVVAITPLPAELIRSYADRLAKSCRVKVNVAMDGASMAVGQVLLAAGNAHLLVRRSGGGLVASVKNGPSIFHQKPSIELLFNSLVEIGDAVGVLLGGAGVDGIAGLLNLRKAGGVTIAEAEATAVLSEAPVRAAACKAAKWVLPADQIGEKMMSAGPRVATQAA